MVLENQDSTQQHNCPMTIVSMHVTHPYGKPRPCPHPYPRPNDMQQSFHTPKFSSRNIPQLPTEFHHLLSNMQCLRH
ncbi:hypothetical protein C1H46_045875 [Malus baccata]|uniref:Uncharacterized protein n=1 Tax=Malus baccata TaxID=106549 RepID=A0A540K3Z5_MALBA|nr:hypothetical protein C1H46_045875 [Malus baccata]